MSWWYVGATVVSSVYGAQQEKRAAKKAADDENDRRNDANIKNTIRAGYRKGLLNVQEGIYKKNALQQGFDTDAAKVTALGAENANAAATGSIGASVNAVTNDIEMRIGELVAKRRDESDLQAFNFEVQAHEIDYDLERSMLSEVTADTPSNARIFGNALLSGATAYASSYAQSRMRLGAGTSSMSRADTGGDLPSSGGTAAAYDGG